MTSQASVRSPFLVAAAGALLTWASSIAAGATALTVDRLDDTLVSTCTAAANDCTLRGALTVAGTGDFVLFDAAVFNPGVINITAALPTVSQGTLTIEGPLTDPPKVIVNGAGAGAGVNGLRVTSDGNVLRGLWIRNFAGDGLVIDGGANNAVGQPCTTGGLVIATGNGGWGARVRGESADNNAFGPDRFGTDGAAALGNGLGGLLVEAGADANTFGNNCGSGPRFEANLGPGIALQDAGTTGNTFPVADVGTIARPNQGPGVLINGASGTSFGYVVNIVGNTGDGLRIASGSGNQFISLAGYGSIHDNGGLAINLVALGDPLNGVTPNDPGDGDSGPNDLLNFPVITSLVGAGGSNVTATGTACANCVVTLYSADGDPSGHGEAPAHLGNANADGSGNWTATVALAIGAKLTAFATDGAGNVSEFSTNVVNPVDLLVVDRLDDTMVTACTAAANDCTLRGALSVAGTGDIVNFDPVVFNPGVINVATALPVVSQGMLTIQGPLTDPPKVILDGLGAGAGVNGLRITSNGNVLRGLWIRKFFGDGVLIDGGASNTVGQICTTSGLVIATGNGGWGSRIRGESADGNAFGPDRFGTDGVAALGNGLGGLLIEAGADNNTFGNGCGSGPRFEANFGPGISLRDAGTTGNTFPVADVGTVTRPNQGPGVLINGASGTAFGYVVNIVGNTGDGLRVESGTGNNFYSLAGYGSIHDNGGLAINLVAPGDPPNGVTPNDFGDLDSGPNDLLNFPVITSLVGAGGSNVTATGTACAGCGVTLYSADGDPSGYGEALTHVGNATADGSGNWTVTVALAIGARLTAFATDGAGNVSELSANVVNPVDVLVVDRLDDTLVTACTAAANDCTLRGALTIAGAGDLFNFDPAVFNPGVINVASALPVVSQGALTLEGPLTDPPKVILDGTAAGAVAGLRVTSNGNVLRGLWLRNFGDDGLVIDGGANNAVGQPCTTNGLVIATSNGGWGARVRGEGADGNTFGPDRFGTDGAASLGNGRGGLLIELGADGNTFGSPCGSAARFEGNLGPGIKLADAGTTGNTFPVAEVGTITRPNQGPGVVISGASGTSFGYVVNIVGNTGDGLRVESGTGNKYFSLGGYGKIHDNGRLGINLVGVGDPLTGVTPNDFGDADSGPNGLLNFPNILWMASQGGGNFLVRGTACAACAVTLFLSNGDPSGHGEGDTQLAGGTADSYGVWAISAFLGVPTPTTAIAAIATDLQQNTSEFSTTANVQAFVGTPAVCGNGATEVGEQCDDSNTSSNDGCSAVCTTESCGDALFQPGLGEQCDDGNTINSDGCTNSCQAVAAAVLFNTTSGLVTTEAGGTATFDVNLSVQPQAAVTVNFASSDATEGSVTASLNFSTADWATPKTATVTGLDDALGDGDIGYTILTGVTSGDTNFAAIDPPDVSVTNQDNDADLGITKDDGAVVVMPNDPLTYTIVVTNYGPTAVTGATVTDVMPVDLISVTWACVATPGSICQANGGGNINDNAVDLLVGGQATYTVSATVAPAATSNITNTATVAVPAGIADPVGGNNSASVTTRLGELIFEDHFESGDTTAWSSQQQ